MADENDVRATGSSAIGDIAYIARSRHRIRALAALTDGPRSRSDLCEMTDVSSSTMRRTLDAFEDRTWIRRVGHRYECTGLGEAVASGMEELIELVETERELRNLWRCLPDDVRELVTDTWTELTVTLADPDVPYRPVNRFKSLFEGADRYRFVGLDAALYEPCKDAFRREVLGGMETEVVDPPRVARYMYTTYPDISDELLDSGNFTVLIHDDLPPYGIALFDDRIAIACYEQESGGVKGLIDTRVADVLEWGESVFRAAKAEARPLEESSIVD